ncbi:MAG TPA: inositol monophosphatase family protein [Saprospiraceae bacterium]|nr:inositol monophosphatase family protein [Saprospiraceae bacterium]
MMSDDPMNEEYPFNYSLLKSQCESVIKECGEEILSHFGKVNSEHIEEKEWNSLVSYVDKNAEIFLVKSLRNIFPEAGFITEENTVPRSQSEWVWVIDPLDGTTNYLEQLPVFSISVGLMRKNEVVVGFVYDPCRDELYHAQKGKGATLNGKRLQIKTLKTMNEVLTATGFPYSRSFDYDTALLVFKQFLKESRDIRRLGSAALDLCYVAAGRFGVYYETNLNIWDVCAGVLIVREAGGEVTDFSGSEEDFLHHGQILAAASHLYPKAFELVQPMKNVF